jgi:hypothetical protein
MIEVFPVLMIMIDRRVYEDPSHPSFKCAALPGVNIFEYLDKCFVKHILCFMA